MQVEHTMSGEVTGISGNTCKRGETYAQAELTNPVRSFTSTIKVKGGAVPLVSVKSAAHVPKGKLMECAVATRGVLAKAPIAIGDVMIPNVCGTGIDLIATTRVSTQ